MRKPRQPKANRDPADQTLQAPGAGLRRQWQQQGLAVTAAAHRRAAQLVAGGWGAVDWGDGDQSGE